MVIPTVIGIETRGFGNKITRREHPDYTFLVIGQSTEKSLEDLRRFARANSSGKPSGNASLKNSQRSK